MNITIANAAVSGFVIGIILTLIMVYVVRNYSLVNKNSMPKQGGKKKK